MRAGQNGTSAWGICLPDTSLKGEKRREERLVLLEKRKEQNRKCTALGLEEDKERQGRALHLGSQRAPKVIAAHCIRHRSTVHFLLHFLARFRATLFTLQFSGCKYGQTEIGFAKQPFSSFDSDNLPRRRTFLLHFAHFFARNPGKWFARALSTVRIHPQKAPQHQAKA